MKKAMTFAATALIACAVVSGITVSQAAPTAAGPVIRVLGSFPFSPRGHTCDSIAANGQGTQPNDIVLASLQSDSPGYYVASAKVRFVTTTNGTVIPYTRVCLNQPAGADLITISYAVLGNS